MVCGAIRSQQRQQQQHQHQQKVNYSQDSQLETQCGEISLCFYRFSLAAMGDATIATNIRLAKCSIDAVNDAPNAKRQWFEDINIFFITFRFVSSSPICAVRQCVLAQRRHSMNLIAFPRMVFILFGFYRFGCACLRVDVCCASFMCHLYAVITVYFRKLYSS